MAEVILNHLDKVYEGSTKVVDDLNLEIRDGEFIVLVGPSGCGKSTTLRMIAGLEEVTSGSIRIGGRVVNDVSPKDRDIAMVFQSYALYPHMTVYENMAFALKLKRRSKADIDAKVRRAADVLGIVGLLDRKPKALSGGQKQRVAVGRAIVRDPQCFLFDEPLSNLDAQRRVEMRTEIRELHEKLASTTVYVTHDQEEAMTLGDRVVVMHRGVAQQVGSAADIYQQPSNRFVAGFLGSPSMNFFRGRLIRQGDELFFDEGSGRLPVHDAVRASLEPHVGDTVVLGVRPELMSDEANARFEIRGNGLKMTVRRVQMLGDCRHVFFATPAHDGVVATVDGYAKFEPEQTLPVHVDMSRAHFFEASESGQRLDAVVR